MTKEELEQLIDSVKNASFEDKVIDALESFGMGIGEHLLVTEKHEANRQSQLFEILKTRGDIDNGHFIIVDHVKSATQLYEILKNNFQGNIVFDATGIFTPACIKLLMGAVCSSPDSGNKWLVSSENKPTFRFSGHIIILTTLSKAEMEKKDKFSYLLRDMRVV